MLRQAAVTATSEGESPILEVRVKVYVASSWRNIERHREVVKAVREAGHEVYDFTDPENGKPFSWSQVTDLDCTKLSGPQVVGVLEQPRSEEGFTSDMTAPANADAVILVMPCGRSAHLELGYAVGASKLTIVLLGEQQEAELMWSMVNAIVTDIDTMLVALDPPLQVREMAGEHAEKMCRRAEYRLVAHDRDVSRCWRVLMEDLANSGHTQHVHRLLDRFEAHRQLHPELRFNSVRDVVMRGWDLPKCDAGCGRRVPDSEARAGFTRCEHCVRDSLSAGVAHE